MAVFQDYAKYYNLLYADKAYSDEVNFILQCLQSVECKPMTIMDLGCGTGRHALEMAKRGLNVTGVDMSETMLQMGQEACGDKIKLIQGDARTVRLNEKFDAVTSLFHVMSYQNTEDDALAHLTTAYEHLNKDGIFLFDFWYGPGVLTDPPTLRKRTLEDDITHIVRTATPVQRVNENIIEVHYSIDLTDKTTGVKSLLQECHPMRYWFIPELKHLAKSAGFEFISMGSWMQDSMPDSSTWNAWMAVKKTK